MALIEITASPKLLERLCAVLERLAVIGDRAFPERKIAKLDKPIGLEAMTHFDPEKAWERELQKQRQSSPAPDGEDQ